LIRQKSSQASWEAQAPLGLLAPTGTLLDAPQADELSVDGEMLGERLPIVSSALQKGLKRNNVLGRDHLHVLGPLDAVGQRPHRVPLV